jgi:dTDP-glucose pyrophosphorylase
VGSTKEIWRKVILPINATILKAISSLNESSTKIVLIVGVKGELVGTVSDGDIRRGLLKGLDISSPITNVIHRNPLVVPPEMGRELVKQLMVINKIQQIPIVDDRNHLVGLHLWDEIDTASVRSNLMVIMAGGFGTRMRPLTDSCPKPMLLVAGKPMLECIIEHAKFEGFSNFILAIHYLGQMIEDHFGNGNRFGVKIDYLREQIPLGTAGALSLLKSRPEAAFVVTNGDVITDIRYGELLDFHSRNDAAATMAVRRHEWQHPFGVVQTQGMEIVGFEEKPTMRSHINAGVYALDPSALDNLSVDNRCDMPTLFERLRTQAKRTLAYPVHEPWLDVGRPVDLNRVNTGDFKNLNNGPSQ